MPLQIILGIWDQFPQIVLMSKYLLNRCNSNFPPPIVENLFTSPTWKNPPSRLPPPKVNSYLPPASLNINIHLIIQKNFIFSCRHSSCTIFILISYSLYTQVMLILILIDVQYLQNFALSYEKGLNGQELLLL